jgi:D-amino-acid dehydrogenase
MRGQVVDLRLEPDETARWPTVRGFTDTSYMVGFAGGRIVLGATREPTAGFDARLTAAGIDDVLSGGLRIAPGLARATIVDARVGLRPVSRDGLPIIGKWPGRDDIFVCTANGAYGLLMGPYSAYAITRVLSGDPPGTDLIPFDPSRFVTIPKNVGSPD